MSSSIEITSVAPPGVNLIRGYGNGGFRIGAGDHQTGSVIVFPDRHVRWQHPPVTEISAVDLQSVIDAASDTDLLVFGCGATFCPAPRSLRDGLRGHGIVLEWMDTGAACRTFNVLLSEGRQVAAALIATD